MDKQTLVYVGIGVVVVFAVLAFFGAGDGGGLPDWFPQPDGE